MKHRRTLKSLLALALLGGALLAFALAHAAELADKPSSLGTDEDILLKAKETRAAPQPAPQHPPTSADRPQVSTSILEEDFESWPPAGWTIVNNGGDCVWEGTAVTGRSNYAGGDGQAAVADSDWCGFDGTMDTELRTPTMDLASHGGGTLDFIAAYNWWSGDECFEVDVSSDGGASWANLLRWTEDHDAYGPGESVSLDLTPYASNSVVVRFHYDAPGWQFYAEVDQVRVLPPMPNVSRSYKLGPVVAVPGQPLTYTLVVSNSGNLSATNTSLVDPIPPNTTFAYTVGPPALIYNSGEDQVEWTGTVTEGESIELTFVVTAEEGIACGLAITNTATITQPGMPSTVALQSVTQASDHIYYVADLEADGGGLGPGGSNSSWAWGVPTSGPRQAHSGIRVWATNLEGVYNDSEDSYLTSPVIDLGAAPSVPGYELWLQWRDWFWSERCCDYGVVEGRGGGLDWIPVSTEFRDKLGGWTEHRVDVSAFAGAGDFQFRFRWHSDSTIAFDGWYVDDIAILQCALPQDLYLWPDDVEVAGCAGISQTHPFGLFNATGDDAVFDLTYSLAAPAYGVFEGPDALFVADQTGTSYVVTLTPDLCLPNGVELLATLEASGNGYSESSYITKTVTTGGSCPVCPDVGWLAGHVYDRFGLDAPCTAAAVHVEPSSVDVTVDQSGYFTVSLVPFDYQVAASANGYPGPDGPYLVQVDGDLVSTRDLVLDRPDLDITPLSLVAEASAPFTATRSFTITSQGTFTLAYGIREVAPMAVGNAGSGSRASAAEFAAKVRAIEVEPELLIKLSADETSGYLIYLRGRPDLSPAAEMDWIERGRFVVEALRKEADRSQARVRAYLDGQGAGYQAFWIDNVIVVSRSSRYTFNGLMGFPEIEVLRARRRPILYEPVEQGPASSDLAGIEPNLTHVGADQVWDEWGVNGEGIVVANIDTGVRYTHEALVRQYRGNLGSGLFDHNHNWWDPALGGSEPAPNDWHNPGHGSHTMGTILGDNGAGTQIGMAPGATWIACQGFEQDDSELLECGQFVAAPWDLTGSNPNPDLRPHVVNNSWGDCLREADHWYDGVIDSWHALGIYPVFSNGNASNCGYSYPPGCDTVGNPARAGNVTGVGSTGRDNGQYAAHSNWGPTDDPDTGNPNGYPNLKPQVLAPGVSIRSAYKSSDTAYGTMSGTSMSAPHVAGLVALMWSAAPCLVGDYTATETIIEQTATPIPYASNCDGEGPEYVPNFAAGWGEIDSYAAVQAAMNFCKTNWLPWVETDVVTGDLASDKEQLVNVTFTCTPTTAQQTQPLEGSLRIIHNDPCREPVDIHLTFFCSRQRPAPLWKKTVWINDQEATPLAGPHVVSPGDTVRIVDWVGGAFSETITSVLTETWTLPLELVGYQTSGVGSETHGDRTLIWDLGGVAPNTFHPITKTFEVQYGDWVSGLITESYTIRDALVQQPDVLVVFEKRILIYLPLVVKSH
jgi:uncharacterized repeat protein (TIGR01451 family)